MASRLSKEVHPMIVASVYATDSRHIGLVVSKQNKSMTQITTIKQGDTHQNCISYVLFNVLQLLFSFPARDQEGMLDNNHNTGTSLGPKNRGIHNQIPTCIHNDLLQQLD